MKFSFFKSKQGTPMSEATEHMENETAAEQEALDTPEAMKDCAVWQTSKTCAAAIRKNCRLHTNSPRKNSPPKC